MTHTPHTNTQGSSPRHYYPLFLAVLPSAFISQRQKKTERVDKSGYDAEREMREIWDDNYHICPSDCQKNCHIHMKYGHKNTKDYTHTHKHINIRGVGWFQRRWAVTLKSTTQKVLYPAFKVHLLCCLEL